VDRIQRSEIVAVLRPRSEGWKRREVRHRASQREDTPMAGRQPD
jgi:hypothetical protein